MWQRGWGAAADASGLAGVPLGSAGMESPAWGSAVGAGNVFSPDVRGGGHMPSAGDAAAQLPISEAGGRGDLWDGRVFQLAVWNSVGSSAPKLAVL